MLKKSLLTILFITILSLFCINVSYAEGENNSMMQNLGNTISNSIDKTESTLNNGMDKLGNEVSNTTGAMKNSFDNMTNRVENFVDNDFDRNTTYNAYRTSADETTTGNMSTTAWTWVIVSMVAIIIITAIWYYAVKSTDRR